MGMSTQKDLPSVADKCGQRRNAKRLVGQVQESPRWYSLEGQPVPRTYHPIPTAVLGSVPGLLFLAGQLSLWRSAGSCVGLDSGSCNRVGTSWVMAILLPRGLRNSLPNGHSGCLGVGVVFPPIQVCFGETISACRDASEGWPILPALSSVAI